MKLLQDSDLLKFVGVQESQYLLRPSEMISKVNSRLTALSDRTGDLLPWSKSHASVQLKSGEVSIWAGINGHGKSQLLGQVCAWNLRYKKWLIASMEMLPEATMERMTRQTAGCPPSENYVSNFLTWADDRLWIYDQTDTVKPDRIIAMALYAAEILKVNHIVIDSLMKCGIRKDDLNMQVIFVDKLCWLAKRTGCHVHLVHHIRKGDKEQKLPGKFDIRGAGEVTDLVDNVFIIHRNKAKEKKIKQGKEVDIAEPDAWLTVDKQRHGEWEGVFSLWFNPMNKQYTAQPGGRVMAFEL